MLVSWRPCFDSSLSADVLACAAFGCAWWHMLLIKVHADCSCHGSRAMKSNVRDGACRVLQAAGALRPGFLSGLAAPSRPSNGSVVSS